MLSSFIGTLATVTLWWLLAGAQTLLLIPGVSLSAGWRVAGGMVFFFDGMITMAWSFAVLIVAQKENRLALTGPYAYVRHPVYGALLYSGTAGMAFAWSSWLVLLAVVPLSVMWSSIANHEEAQLIERYGDGYRAYQTATGQLFPDLRQKFGSGGDRPGQSL